MKRICVLTDDRFLFQKIKLGLKGRAEVTDSPDSCAVRIVDIDSGFAPTEGDLTVSRYSECDLKIPFTLESLINLQECSGPIISAPEGKRCAVLRGEVIKLTEVEHALFLALMKRGGEFASREDILREVWGSEADEGIINVYVHYLREKLEKSGEKIIVSSRKLGYKIDGKYLGGDKEC